MWSKKLKEMLLDIAIISTKMQTNYKAAIYIIEFVCFVVLNNI
jgi:hypothetical protein